MTEFDRYEKALTNSTTTNRIHKLEECLREIAEHSRDEFVKSRIEICLGDEK